MWNVGFSVAAADRLNEEQIRKNLNILPPSRLLALYADLRNGSSETPNKLEECTPPSKPPKNNKTKTNKSSVRPLDTNGALKAESFQKRAAGICLIGRAARHKHPLHHHTPLSPPSLSCMQIGLNIVVPHHRAVGTGFANMSRVREGIKKTNAWKEEGINVSLVQNHS